MSDKVTCPKCGTVHFTVDPDYIKQWSAEWIDFWLNSSYQTRENYGLLKAPPGPRTYFCCSTCDESYKNFRDYQDGDMPDGCTQSPILHYKY